MYRGHARLCVCVSVRGRMPTLYCTDPDVTWGSGRGCPLVVHYLADLQSVHGLRCYGNITRTRTVSEYMLVLALCLANALICRRCRLVMVSATAGVPVDGQWSEWSEWSACSVCGPGFHSRIRHCDAPAPQHGGLACIGNDEQWQECSYGHCQGNVVS